MADIREGPNAGSLYVVGNTAYGRLMNEQTFHERAILDGSEWRLKHNESRLFLRGFMWYERKYSLLERDCEVRCPKCETHFNDEAVQVQPVCPSCGYPGDV